MASSGSVLLGCLEINCGRRFVPHRFSSTLWNAAYLMYRPVSMKNNNHLSYSPTNSQTSWRNHIRSSFVSDEGAILCDRCPSRHKGVGTTIPCHLEPATLHLRNPIRFSLNLKKVHKFLDHWEARIPGRQTTFQIENHKSKIPSAYGLTKSHFSSIITPANHRLAFFWTEKRKA